MPDRTKATLLVASGGGHLAQLHRLWPRLAGVPRRAIWVTFDTPQARSLLAAEKDVIFARFVRPRGYRAVAENARLAGRLLRRPDVEALVSTGSGLALSFFPLAPLFGTAGYYIESAARSDGPSLTGRVVATVPGVRHFTQYPSWADDRWSYTGSVFDDFVPLSTSPRALGRPLRVLVTLGTIPYSFRRLVDRLVTVLPPEAEVVWQVGTTDGSGLPGSVHGTLGQAELSDAMRHADVVVAHAGVGSALDAFAVGRVPVLIPREFDHGEHVDDHQQQIAGRLADRGLAVAVMAQDLTREHLEDATRASVADARQGPPLVLTG